ncbi:hypothetical protein PROFUN_11015 [Planoprotostelium fungivorum]|uniref:Uncharacterized protein n=1 Tax=Planoprotostelium fungivorum TaxID=1890364 RepID=A0A2P6NBQ0_9EUKA|nr:hypothetical protein PROFUN_11015 [Planoprotostelium fungivorum]
MSQSQPELLRIKNMPKERERTEFSVDTRHCNRTKLSSFRAVRSNTVCGSSPVYHSALYALYIFVDLGTKTRRYRTTVTSTSGYGTSSVGVAAVSLSNSDFLQTSKLEIYAECDEKKMRHKIA